MFPVTPIGMGDDSFLGGRIDHLPLRCLPVPSETPVTAENSVTEVSNQIHPLFYITVEPIISLQKRDSLKFTVMIWAERKKPVRAEPWQ